jgi:aminoglycoside phosphotransferase (APT) family kinase protein
VDSPPAIDIDLVRRLVDAQFPEWTGLPLELLDSAGSDHAIYRLGKELSVRLPHHSGALGQARKEFEWLPRLAPCLPLAIPVPLGVGAPAFGYPWSWSVSRWLDGEVATIDALADSSVAVIALGEFLTALQRFAPAEIPALVAREDLSVRPLAERDRATRAAIAAVDGMFDAAAMTRLWDDFRRWPGVWPAKKFALLARLLVHEPAEPVHDSRGLAVGPP